MSLIVYLIILAVTGLFVGAVVAQGDADSGHRATAMIEYGHADGGETGRYIAILDRPATPSFESQQSA